MGMGRNSQWVLPVGIQLQPANRPFTTVLQWAGKSLGEYGESVLDSVKDDTL